MKKSNQLNIILNGENVKGNPGETILELAKRHGIKIPTLCNDPRLKPFSSCFVCVVEVEGMKGMQPSCSTKIQEGMKIETENEKVTKARKTALDLLVSNHYADCEAPCKQTCPAGVDVQGYISLIEKGLYSEAIGLIKQTNPLPAICGRVCVRPCELACRRNYLEEGAAVGIDYLKRFAADKDLLSENRYIPKIEPSTGKKVAIIGAGPGGLSSAYFLQQKGHQCDIYEANPNPGGWLRYGIPEYRLPNDILDQEVAAVTELGVNIFYNKKLGDNLSYKELKKKYDSVILTIGSQRGTLIGCEGDDAENVFSGIDFLRNMEMTGQKYDFTGKTVAVVGGGNTAMDCCRTSVRCGAEKVYVIYRRTEKEMPANPIEIHESKIEGVEYMFLTNPVKINKDKDGKLKTMACIKMELGEPDSSGRRRPIPIEGSEFDIELDYALAAIGQKTEVNFLDDINKFSDNEKLEVNRWGDIAADENTLQTGIKSIFAAGDGVTGPATIIEAIAQAKVASKSCHQYLSGLTLEPEPEEFISRKDNFKELSSDEFLGRYQKQLREEMPVLPADKRKNFEEVELGYQDEKVAEHETARCMECGCSEIFTCDLKKYSTQYHADQKRFKGDFQEYPIDFSHPFIEIDNNKCILCARCVRICNEVVGANALGLVNRGFDTYVAPSMGGSLTETNCESCGLCISTCPTGAITENTSFKPGPVEMDTVNTICNYCSVGCELEYHHKSSFVWEVTGKEGLINKDGNICRYPKFGYTIMNDSQRITQPLLKVDDDFEAISWEKAFEVIADEIKGAEPDENGFFAGARLSNEEMYLIQKLARAGAKTNNVTSFHYVGQGSGYEFNYKANVPFEDIKKASKIYLLGTEISKDNAVVGFMVNNAREIENVPVELITTFEESALKHKVGQIFKIKSYYHFIKAINYYLVSKGLQNSLFIKDRCEGFEEYKKELLGEDYQKLITASGMCCQEHLEEFAENYNKEMNAIIIFSEKYISANVSKELFNLAMITGKLGKTASGLISLKEKNNAQGLFDMGISSKNGVGYTDLTDKEFTKRLMKKWNIKELPELNDTCTKDLLNEGLIKKFYIFGEDPIGCAMDKAKIQKWFTDAEFLMVQDYVMTETAKQADLILPATFPVESSGSFTNTQKNIQIFEKQFKGKVEKENYIQLLAIIRNFSDNENLKTVDDIRKEIFELLPQKNTSGQYAFKYTMKDNWNKLFKHGCDFVVKKFDEDFNKAFNQ
ncbi:MAG: molybdopterin-dependent oxidoreductase [Bacteroidota bacterium]|nr:molybdopterin-dependent oxidoreductase [Bacteroidota bacterium]